VVALLYPHVTAILARAVFREQTGMNNLMEKNFLLAASRVGFGGIRAALSPEVRTFLAQNGPRIREIFNATANRINQGQAALSVGMVDFVDGSVDLFQHPVYGNLMNMFLHGDQLPDGTPIAEVTMYHLGMNTSYAEIDTYPDDMIPVEMRDLTGSFGDPSTVDATSEDIMNMLRPYAGPQRMSAANAADLNRNNAAAIDESARANAELTSALRHPATYEQTGADAAAAARNFDTTGMNLRYAYTAYTAIHNSFDSDSPHTAAARDNLDNARQAHATAQDLLLNARQRWEDRMTGP